MSTYTPKVGDTVRRPNSRTTILVTAVGERWFLGVPSDGGRAEQPWALDPDDATLVGAWVKVEPTPADHYLTFAPNGEVSGLHATKQAAGEWCRFSDSDRVARFSFAEWVVPGE